MQPLEESTFLKVTNGASQFLLPIEDVREVSEILPIREYPYPVKGHLGVINLRGKVIPVLSMEQFLEGDRANVLSGQDLRIVVVHAEDDCCFAILASSVKKVALSSEALLTASDIIPLDGKPVRLLRSKSLWQHDEAEAA